MELKPKDEELFSIVKDDYNKLPDSVKEYLSDVLIKKASNLLLETDSCQSPIEQLMWIALSEQTDKILPYYTNDFFINTQEVIEANGSKYRVDFFVVIRFKEKYYGFVVECDGHDFHEKTKEQAKKDKKRDRDLMLIGHPVIRFTGSEIYENPTVCAREVTNLIINTLLKD